MLRRLLLALGAILLLVAIAAAAGLWWLGTDSGLRFAIDKLQDTMSAQGGDLVIERPSGSLHRGIRIGQLTWRSASGMQVEGSDLSVRWSLPALLRRQLLIPELSAASVSIRLAAPDPSPAPRQRTEMPGVLALPVSVVLERLAVAELRVTPAPAPGGPQPEPAVITDIGAGLAYRGGVFVVSDLGASTPYGRLSGAHVEIGDSPPHALQARLSWDGEWSKLPLAFELAAEGDLDAAQASLTGTVADARIALAARLAPLAAMPLVSAQADLANLDLRQLHGSAPRTMIDAELSLAPAAGADWTGTIALRNQDSGVLSEGKLPLLALDTQLSLADPEDPANRRLTLQQLQLTLPGHATDTPGAGARGGSAQPGDRQGSIGGSIDVQPGRTLTIAGIEIPAVHAALDFKAIDLAQFGAQLPPTALDGKFGLRDNAFTLELAQSAARMRALMPAPTGRRRTGSCSRARRAGSS